GAYWAYEMKTTPPHFRRPFSLAQVTLTPALSRRERGNDRPSWLQLSTGMCVSERTSGSSFSISLSSAPSGGEGTGRGGFRSSRWLVLRRSAPVPGAATSIGSGSAGHFRAREDDLTPLSFDPSVVCSS